MAHQMEFRGVENGMAVFCCKACKRPLGFYLPETMRSDAAVDLGDGSYAMPAGAENDGSSMGIVERNLGRCDH